MQDSIIKCNTLEQNSNEVIYLTGGRSQLSKGWFLIYSQMGVREFGFRSPVMQDLRKVGFDGRPSNPTFLSPGLITADISADLFNTPGNKEISIKQVVTEKLFSVGVFSVAPK